MYSFVYGCQVRNDVLRLHRDDNIHRPLMVLASHHLPSVEHSERVAVLYADMCLENGIQDTTLTGTLGILHDIGKVAISSRLLFYQGELTAAEKGILRMHVHVAYHLLSYFDYTPANSKVSAQSVVGYHHGFKREGRYVAAETDDPFALLLAEILAAADVTDRALSPPNPKTRIPSTREELVASVKQHYAGNEKFVEQAVKRVKRFS